MGGNRGTVIAFAALAAIAVALLAALLWLPPQFVGDTTGLTAKERLDALNDARGTLISALGGVVVFGGLLFTARTYLSSREGQVTDRYTAAVNQLGSAEAQVRLGGIYALERIARDSVRDRSTVIEILAALVRETSHASNRSARLAEIHAALTVLSRLPGSGDERAIDLRGAKLAGVRVPGLALRGAALDGADLAGAHLPGADLRNATLDYITAAEVNLGGARLADARGTDAQLPGSVLEGADLARAQFPSANFTGCRMAGVDLSDVNLTQASLAGALLTRGQDGRPARAARAVFVNAVLAKATLEGVDLSSAVGLIKEQRASASADRDTRWPADTG